MTQKFGNYRGFVVNPITRNIDIALSSNESVHEALSTLDHRNAIRSRDEKIAMWLAFHQVDFLLDIGCDFGSLLNEAEKAGIDALGFDINDESLALLESAGLKHKKISIEEILSERNLLLPDYPREKTIRAVSCLNIIHSGHFDSTLRNQFINICLNEMSYVVITTTRKILRELIQSTNCKVVGYISGVERPLTTANSQLLQYGTTFKFKGLLHKFEKQIWKKIRGRYSHPLPSHSYERLVVILAKRS